jgi:hypothetical protein
MDLKRSCLMTRLNAHYRCARRILLLAMAIGSVALSLAATQFAPPPPDGAAVADAIRLLSAPPQFDVEYNYELTIDIRLLFFWTGKDDVGGGYIKMGHVADDPSLEIIRLLFGSDPARAHGINRWGSGMEVAKRTSARTLDWSAFFGFMKSSQGESVGAMQQELADEKQRGQHRFEAIISRVDPGGAVSTTVPFYSDHDYDFRELDQAEKVVLEQVQQGQDRKFHALDPMSAGCSRDGSFLTTLQELTHEALEGRSTPQSLCYIFNSRAYTVTLDAVRPLSQKTVRFTLGTTKEKVVREYRDLKEARLHTLNRATGQKTYFSVLLGTEGTLRGAPVQISYQPNWWFRITLNLKAPSQETATGR